MADVLKTITRGATETDAAPVVFVNMPTWQMVLVRTVRTYIQTLTGMLSLTTTGLAGKLGIEAGEFGHQLMLAASLAVAPAVMSLLMNLGEILSDLDVTKPRLRA